MGPRDPVVPYYPPPTWCPMSADTITHRVLPSDVNHLGTLFGGRLMEWLDGAAEIVATRYARRVVVTVAMEQVVFTLPVRVGDLVRIEVAIDRIGRTSIGVQVTAWRESIVGETVVACAARLTFVALDETGRPVSVQHAFPGADAGKPIPNETAWTSPT